MFYEHDSVVLYEKCIQEIIIIILWFKLRAPLDLVPFHSR